MPIGEAMKESELGDLGIFRIPIPIPFSQAGGPANVYIIEEECGLMVFDTGLGTESSQVALAEGLARIGHRLEEVNRIVISHGHIDHFGSAAWIQEQAGRSVPIFIHSADADKVLESGLEWPAMLDRNSQYFLMLGVPLAVLEETAVIMSRNPSLGRRLAEVHPLIPGEKFRCKHVTLEALHMPGHTTGLCCLYEADHRLLFSADHLLERVSPNPLMDLGPEGKPSPFQPLISYFRSINRLRALSIDLILPGHAEPFAEHLSVIDSLIAFYTRRQSKLLKALKRGSLTVYEAMQELFSRKSGFELILMLSETLGNLEVLEDKGETKREMDGDCIRFRLAV
jgi:glyoxylase-like metal-dependent hydrolase (beta-lactamase superfamily II)